MAATDDRPNTSFLPDLCSTRAVLVVVVGIAIILKAKELVSVEIVNQEKANQNVYPKQERLHYVQVEAKKPLRPQCVEKDQKTKILIEKAKQLTLATSLKNNDI